VPYRICWAQSSVDQILQTEALAGNDDVFLATHFPIEGFDVGGSHAAEVSGGNEQSLFEALSRDSVRHAFCVVRGEPGSGKSHLIRWLDIQWRNKEGEDLVLLIQRADGSLQNTLEQLRKLLPLDGDALLWQGIATRDGITFEGRVKLFHDALGHSLGPNFLEEEKDDVKWCEERELSALLLAPEVRDHWTAPFRILDIVSGRNGARNSEMAQFQVQDIRDLVSLSQAIQQPKRAHIRFLQKLRTEFEAFDDLANQDKPFSETVPEGSRFLHALNERLNPAIQRFLGISPQGLKELFRRLRRKLHTENRRLVLLLEDITSFQGVDNLLIDVLVTDSQTRPDECDLISVVGLTPSYFENTFGGLGNIVARITHLIRLGRGDHGFERITSLESADSQVRFTAKYLNAVRLGIDRIRNRDSVSNECDNCPDRSACHRSFGSKDGYGLYPLTETYIERNYSRLVDPEGKLTQQTPRGLLQNLVHPALFHVHDLQRGEYPPPEFPIAPIQGATELPGPIRDRLTAVAHGDVGILARLRLLLGLWGNGSSSVATSRAADGESEFAGIGESIFQTFELPWPGTADEEQPQPPSDESEGLIGTDTPEKLEPRPPKPTTPQKPTSPRTIRAGDLGRRIAQLATWEDKGSLEDPQFWNQQLWKTVAELPWPQLDIPYYLWRRLYTERLTLLAGTGQARSGHLVVPAEPWVFRGLHGYLCLRSQSDSAGIVLSLQYAARFRRKLQQLVVDHMKTRMASFRTTSNELWQPVHTAVQVLAARAWLRGDVKPLADETKQWQVLLSDEPEASSAPRQRVDSWDEFVTKGTGSSHSTIRDVLRDWVTLPQASEPGSDLVEASLALRAIRELKKNVAYTRLPVQALAAAGNRQISELVTLSEKAIETAGKLNGLPAREASRIDQRAEDILASLRGNSVSAHIERIEKAISAILQYLQNVAPAEIQKWKQEVTRLRASGYLALGAPAVNEVEEFLVRLDQEDPSTPADVLEWCLDAPVQAMTLLTPALESGEAVVIKVTEYVSAYLGRHASASRASLEEVHKIGKRLSETARAIESTMRVNHE
jgi:hypothetical protein